MPNWVAPRRMRRCAPRLAHAALVKYLTSSRIIWRSVAVRMCGGGIFSRTVRPVAMRLISTLNGTHLRRVYEIPSSCRYWAIDTDGFWRRVTSLWFAAAVGLRFDTSITFFRSDHVPSSRSWLGPLTDAAPESW